MIQTLRALTALGGPSGFEGPVAEAAVAFMASYMDEACIDRFGNAVGVRRCGKPGAPRVLLDAHLDEIGCIVTGAEEGFLRFRAIGGVDERVLPDREVTVLTDPPLFGVIACMPPHVLSQEDMKKALTVDQLYIDVGLSQEEAEKAVPVGTPVVYRDSGTPMGSSAFCGKSLDDRAGFAALLRAMELLQDKPLDVDLYLLGSTREEVGHYGAKVGAYGINPDCCIAVDVTYAKTHDSSRLAVCGLDDGPAIGMGPNMTRWMVDRLLDKARALDIPHVREVVGGNSHTNAWDMQISREGVPTALVSIPLRYMHTPGEVLVLEDIERTAELLAAFVEGLGEEAVVRC